MKSVVAVLALFAVVALADINDVSLEDGNCMRGALEYCENPAIQPAFHEAAITCICRTAKEIASGENTVANEAATQILAKKESQVCAELGGSFNEFAGQKTASLGKTLCVRVNEHRALIESDLNDRENAAREAESAEQARIEEEERIAREREAEEAEAAAEARRVETQTKMGDMIGADNADRNARYATKGLGSGDYVGPAARDESEKCVAEEAELASLLTKYDAKEAARELIEALQRFVNEPNTELDAAYTKAEEVASNADCNIEEDHLRTLANEDGDLASKLRDALKLLGKINSDAVPAANADQDSADELADSDDAAPAADARSLRGAADVEADAAVSGKDDEYNPWFDKPRVEAMKEGLRENNY